MKTLYIMRHAKSNWDFEELSDHDRPLSDRGRKAAPLMARELLSREVELDLIISSSAVRALTTASLVAREFDFDAEKIAVDERIYKVDKHELLNIIKDIPDEFKNVLMVGHNYTITEFTNLLSPELIPDIPTAGVVGLTFKTDNWSDISKENADFNFFDYPKNHK